jgi:hypothetical protein
MRSSRCRRARAFSWRWDGLSPFTFVSSNPSRAMLRRGFCFQPLRSLCHAETKESFEFQVVKTRDTSIFGSVLRPCRPFPWIQFVGGEERGYFALEKAGSNPAGACIVAWRRPREGCRVACSSSNTLRWRGLARSRPFPDKTIAAPVVKKSVTSQSGCRGFDSRQPKGCSSVAERRAAKPKGRAASQISPVPRSGMPVWRW